MQRVFPAHRMWRLHGGSSLPPELVWATGPQVASAILVCQFTQCQLLGPSEHGSTALGRLMGGATQEPRVLPVSQGRDAAGGFTGLGL